MTHEKKAFQISIQNLLTHSESLAVVKKTIYTVDGGIAELPEERKQ